jgi:hypothetical protein
MWACITVEKEGKSAFSSIPHQNLLCFSVGEDLLWREK